MSWAKSNGVPKTNPTRLLELDYSAEPPRARLLASTDRLGAHVRYVTLSHCWGDSVPLRLVHSNMGAMEDGIDIQQLPRTFQECFRVAHEVGIRYLWIDSLCIVQDSEEDWQREAGLMEQVYSNCYLNIAASESSNGTEGLFRERDPRSAGSTYVQITWVVQERFLSPRTVHYHQEQLAWECSESFTLEGLPAGVDLRKDASTLFKQHNASIATIPLSADKLYKVYELWDTLVIRYTTGCLSFSSDRPIAVAGIARVICHHLNLAPSDYHSGLWRPRFVEGLCWIVINTPRKTKHAFMNFQKTAFWAIRLGPGSP
ncbi:hypothetical protein PG997_012840 [Apiospora hydei]|uniref:Heterokaryon incompatibility domain-containing protein n=1 Tax=Apiospora hydei TaxID=1337664 RepID=A0ABR1V7Z0_9PEZI